MWPKFDGRWPLTSGICFKFDPSQPVGSRIVPGSMTDEEGNPIEMEKYYTLASKYFIATGKDGYTTFLDPGIRRIGNWDEAPLIQDIIANFLKNFSKTPEELDHLTPLARAIFERRL